MKKYISADSHVELPCIIDRSKSAHLYFLVGQPVPRSRPVPGNPWLRGVLVRSTGRYDGSVSASGGLVGNQQLKETPTTSNRKIARLLGLDHKSGQRRDHFASGGEFPHVTTHQRRRRKNIRLAITVGFQGVQRDQRASLAIMACRRTHVRWGNSPRQRAKMAANDEVLQIR